MAEDIALATPTRFLIENGEWNLTPSLAGSINNEINPFECNFPSKSNDNTKWIVPSPTMYTEPVVYASPEPAVYASPEPVVYASPEPAVYMSPEPEQYLSLTQSRVSSRSSYSSSSDSSIDTPSQPEVIAPTAMHSPISSPQEVKRRSSRIQTKPQPSFDKEDQNSEKKAASTHGGRKRRIIFDGEDAEDRRKKFLERNRMAAYKCRQKKKNWMRELEQKAEIQNKKSAELRALVAQLKEESICLRNLLLTHGNCNCDSVQAYLRKTSAEITINASPTLSRRDSNTTTITTTTANTFSYNPVPSFAGTSTGLTPFLNTVINKTPVEPNDYFSQSHTQS